MIRRNAPWTNPSHPLTQATSNISAGNIRLHHVMQRKWHIPNTTLKLAKRTLNSNKITPRRLILGCLCSLLSGAAFKDTLRQKRWVRWLMQRHIMCVCARREMQRGLMMELRTKRHSISATLAMTLLPTWLLHSLPWLAEWKMPHEEKQTDLITKTYSSSLS